MTKPIRFSGHSYERLLHRGATEQEVIETIRIAPWTQAERGRQECGKDFAFGREWNGKIYATKRIRPIFVEEQHEILVVTVYVYYF
ncbi:MAG: hypothetical protein ACRD2O_04270 [Terriglobia bacterium]